MPSEFEKFALTRLRVYDFRCFHDVEIALNGQPREIRLDSDVDRTVKVAPLTVLVARNGMGKTAILDAIRILFGTYTSAFPSKSYVHADPGSIRMYRSANGQLCVSTGLHIAGDVLLDGKRTPVSRELVSDDGARTTSKNVKPLVAYARGLREGSDAEWPVLAYYGTGRLWGTSKETEQKRLLLKQRDFGYRDCLAVLHNFRVVNWWLTRAINKRRVDSRDALVQDETINDQIDAITSALDKVLAPEGYRANLTYDVERETLAIRKELPDGTAIPMPIDHLSDGVKAVLGLVSDIAFRCAKLNPRYGKDAARRTSGIVMIDEVDLHLHPSWQQRILDALQLAFPRIQFIVTTHSPQVIASIPRECVRIVTPDGIRVLKAPTQGVEVKEILQSIFGTSPAPRNLEIVQKLDRLIAMTSEGLGDTEAWQRLYSELCEYYGDSYGPLLGAVRHRDFLRRMKEERGNA